MEDLREFPEHREGIDERHLEWLMREWREQSEKFPAMGPGHVHFIKDKRGRLMRVTLSRECWLERSTFEW